jgi:hypothetical protein
MKAMYSMLQRESWNTAASLPSNEVHLVMSVSKRLRGVCTFPVFTSCTHHWHERVSLYVCSGLMGCGECSQNSQLSRYTKPVLQQERLCASVTAANCMVAAIRLTCMTGLDCTAAALLKPSGCMFSVAALHSLLQVKTYASTSMSACRLS